MSLSKFSYNKYSYILMMSIIVFTIYFFSYRANGYVDGIIMSHYVALVVNNIYLAISNDIISQTINIQNILIPRETFKKYIYNNIIKMFMRIFVYVILLQLISILMYGQSSIITSQSLFYTFLMVIVLFFEEALLMQQLVFDKHQIFVAISIFTNLIIHYCFIIPNI